MSELSEFDIIASLFEEIALDTESSLKYRQNNSPIQKYLYFLYEPVADYTKSVILLCRNSQLNAAKAILRSLVEAHLQCIYYQAEDTDNRLVEAIIQGYKEKDKIFHGLKTLIKKYPALSSEDENSLYNNNKLDELSNNVNAGISELRGRLTRKYKEEPSLRIMSEQCDLAKIAGVNAGHFESMYVFEYRRLSPVVHLNMFAFDHFYNESEEGIVMSKSANQEILLIKTAIGIYVALVKDLYDHGVINKNKPDSLTKIETLL